MVTDMLTDGTKPAKLFPYGGKDGSLVKLFPLRYNDNLAVLASLSSNPTLLQRSSHPLAISIVSIILPILLPLVSCEHAMVKEQAHYCKTSPCQILCISPGIHVPLGRPPVHQRDHNIT